MIVYTDGISSATVLPTDESHDIVVVVVANRYQISDSLISVTNSDG